MYVCTYFVRTQAGGTKTKETPHILSRVGKC